ADASQQPTSFANGRYEVKRFLGEGGKKKVYLAHDARLDRDVAFALIKTEGLDDAARERVSREAQAMGRLGNHPNVVTVYDIGDEDGQPYMVLPVLAGGDVEGVVERAEEHKLPLERAIEIAVDTCQGLELAHGKGIVHRDLKPGNVWLTEDGRAMIGDFGLAVAVDRSRLTQAGMMVGTVSYMPPEQAMGGEVTPRSDLYSLGAMLYEMVCGRPPFVGDESVAIIGQHLNTPPVAPTWHRPDCPPALETLILRLLEKDPLRRPQSATEVREALQAVETSVGVVREPPLHDASSETLRPVADPLYRTVFVGREQELRQLQQAYDAAVSGQGGLVMVVGEPGIGKTALCEQLATYVSIRGGRTLVGHCYEEGSLSLPYLAFVEAMRTYVLARDPDGLKSDLGTGAADVARIVSEVRDRVQVELRDASDPEDDRWRLLQSVTTFLRNAASVQPLVIVLEDLHWADRGTLDLLQHVARNLQGARLVVVGTYRDVEVDRTHPLSGTLAELRRASNFLRVPLRGLTVDEVHRMYEAIRGNEVPWGQAEAVHRQTEGNPLFVQEVLRYLVEEGYVVRQGARYVGQGLGVGIPEGLRDVVGRRLNRLGEKANRVLGVAAVIGREFRLDVLQMVLDATEEELFGALEEAQERAIIEQHDVLGAMGFRFTHAFFRQTLYEEIFAPRRIRVHQQVGRAIEDVYARRLDEHAAELAEHFSQSTEAADLEKAVLYAEMAAKRALSVFDHGEAVGRLEQALKANEVLGDEDTSKRCDLLLAMVRPLSMIGEPLRAAQEIAEEAFQLAEKLGDNRRALLAFRLADQAISRYGRAWPFSGREVWSKRGDRLALPGTVDRVFADVALGLAIADNEISSVVPERWEYWRRAYDLALSLGDNEAMFRAGLFAIITKYFRGGHWDEALTLAEEATTWPREGVSSAAVGEVLWHCSNVFYQHGLMDRCSDVESAMASLGEKARDSDLTMFAAFMRARAACHEGRLQDAWTEARGLQESGKELRAPFLEGLGLLSAMRPGFYMGRDMHEIEVTSNLPGVPRTLAIALLEAHTGNPGRAVQQLRDYAGSMEDVLWSDGGHLNFVVALEVATAIGDAELIRSFLEGTSEFMPGFERYMVASVARTRAAASVLLGENTEGRSLYEQAIESCLTAGNRPELALSHLGLAELLLEHYPEERDSAIEHLDFAIAEFQGMKMQPALERALRHRGLLKA
ncbi:MAG TPA: AAA family ATPase, partial [Dehalococcoidia bacterium]|nr:AAA family ATPase [Dehalococcoidia bacterium]